MNAQSLTRQGKRGDQPDRPAAGNENWPSIHRIYTAIARVEAAARGSTAAVSRF
jgi:hypothetical protein